MKYNLVVCGGTFDHFHKGHKAFLQFALMISNRVLLGITSDTYVQHHKRSKLQTFDLRKKTVEAFFKKEHALDKVTIAPIESIFYPKKWERLPIEAIVVTEETKKGGEIINQDRKEKGLPELAVVIVPFVDDDAKQKISSTNIRGGTINTQGISYVQPSWFAQDLLLPEIEKQWFKKPLGELITDISLLRNNDPQKLVSVGDVVTRDCNSMHLNQKLSVIDFIIQRKHTFRHVQELGFTGKEKVLYADNPSSHLTPELFHAITQAITLFSSEKRIVIVVNGEEDLAVVPLVLALPLDFIIVYGQPNQGLVRLLITSEVKKYAYTLLQRFVSK